MDLQVHGQFSRMIGKAYIIRIESPKCTVKSDYHTECTCFTTSDFCYKSEIAEGN